MFSRLFNDEKGTLVRMDIQCESIELSMNLVLCYFQIEAEIN